MKFLNELLPLIIQNNDVVNLEKFISLNFDLNICYLNYIDLSYNLKYYEIFKLLIEKIDNKNSFWDFRSYNNDENKFARKCILEKEYDYFFLLFQKIPSLMTIFHDDIKKRLPDFNFPKAQSIIDNHIEKKINYHELIKYISSNDINGILNILKKEIDISICDNYAFIISMYYENIEIIKLLLVNIYDIDKLMIDINENLLFINQSFYEKLKPMIEIRKEKIKEILELENKIKELKNTFL